jgi:hypothetical protein
MDKMKGLTKWLKKYHFWVLVVVLLLVGFAVFWLATGSLAEESDADKSKIKQQFSSMDDLARFERHPNDEYSKFMDGQIVKTRDSVQEAWEVKYDKQGNLFEWPEGLGKDFLDAVKDLRPIEATVPFPTGEEPLKINLRERYRLYIKRELPKLAEMIGADPNTPTAARPGFGFGGAPPAGGGEENGTGKTSTERIVWLNQQEIQDNHFDWSRQQPSVPSTLQVLYAQEDLWVLTALMEIIFKTNGGKESAELPISQIDYIRIGKSAQKLQGKVAVGKGEPIGAAGHGEMPSEEGVPYEEPVFEGEEGTLEGTGEDPADGRYVDMDNNKLSGQQLRGTTSGDAGAQQGTLAVAKRIPVQMKLVIHQQQIPKLLVECGNSPLTVEVQQLRFNPEVGASRGRGEEAGMAPTSSDSKGRQRDYVPVELYGIISVFNPVEYTALGVKREQAEAAEEGPQEPVGDDTQPADRAGESPEVDAPDTGPDADDAAEGTEPAAAGPAEAAPAAGGQPAADGAAEPATP